MKYRYWLSVAAGAVVGFVVSASPQQTQPAVSGQWLSYRAGAALDAHSELKGHITSPKIAWRQFVGEVDTFFLLDPNAPKAADPYGRAELTVPARDIDEQRVVDELSQARWGLEPPAAIVAGKLQPVLRTTDITYAHVLPETPAEELQKFEFESGFDRPTVKGQWQPGRGRCLRWHGDKWEQVWQTEPIEMLFLPYPIVGDFDGDGSPELAILPWKELLLFDARTGKPKDQCAFAEGRAYGFFGAYDLDGDGKSEFIIVADFAKYVAVLGCRDTKLTRLWRDDIELEISNPQYMVRAHPNPVADVDGDGRLELMVNVYDPKQGRWGVRVYDGMTGKLKTTLAGELMQGLADLDGDRAAELLTVKTDSSGIPEYGTICVQSLRTGEAESLWQLERAAWQSWDPPLRENVNSGATLARRDALCRAIGGKAHAVIRRPGESGVKLSIARWGNRRFDIVGEVEGIGLEAIALDPDGVLLARASTPAAATARISIANGSARVVASRRTAFPPAHAVVARSAPAERPTIIVQGSDSDLVLFAAPSARVDATEPVHLCGRGQSDNWPARQHGPVVADLAGDGSMQLLRATAAPSGDARLVASDLLGAEKWHHDFKSIPGSAPVWNTGGIVLWQTGHFTDARRRDVLVTVRRSMMHSEETCLLSGVDGRELWRRNRQINDRGVGGPFAIGDFDGDGLDDAATFYPSEFYILHGKTGADVIAKSCEWPNVPAKPVFWGLPVTGDFENVGKPSLFFASSRGSMNAVVRSNGSLAWFDFLDHGAFGYPAFGHFDRSGRLQAIGAGFENQEIRCLDTATGKVLWRISAPDELVAGPARVVESASADLDSDGKDEAVFTAGKFIYCIGSSKDGSEGAVLWKLQLPATIGPPTIADVEGNGEASILVVGDDSTVYCIRW